MLAINKNSGKLFLLLLSDSLSITLPMTQFFVFDLFILFI